MGPDPMPEPRQEPNHPRRSGRRSRRDGVETSTLGRPVPEGPGHPARPLAPRGLRDPAGTLAALRAPPGARLGAENDADRARDSRRPAQRGPDRGRGRRGPLDARRRLEPGRPDHPEEQPPDRRERGLPAARPRRAGEQPLPVRPPARPGVREAGRRRRPPPASRALLEVRGTRQRGGPPLPRVGDLRRARRASATTRAR